MDKERFKQLYQLAHGGNMVAKADLWIEFEFAFDHDPYPAWMREPYDGRACSPSATQSAPHPSAVSAPLRENNPSIGGSTC
jgi:hypothetical protein